MLCPVRKVTPAVSDRPARDPDVPRAAAAEAPVLKSPDRVAYERGGSLLIDQSVQVVRVTLGSIYFFIVVHRSSPATVIVLETK
jgi:hypothetical protein